MKTSKQVGPSCVAFAMYNAGMVDDKAVNDYLQRMQDGSRYLAKHYPLSFFGIMADWESEFPPPDFLSHSVGTPQFINAWREANNITFPTIDGPVLAAQVPEYIRNHHEEPDNLTGSGVIYVVLGPFAFHALAFENGKVVDSDTENPKEETWQEFSLRMLERDGQLPQIINIIRKDHG